MTEESNKDVFAGSDYAKEYRKGRPRHPDSLAEAMVSFLKEKVIADRFYNISMTSTNALISQTIVKGQIKLWIHNSIFIIAVRR